MNKTNSYFTTNQSLTLQNFTWGGVYKPLLNKEFCNKLNEKIIIKNMIKFTVNCNF